MDLFKINGLTWWDKVNRPKKISQALVSIKKTQKRCFHGQVVLETTKMQICSLGLSY